MVLLARLAGALAWLEWWYIFRLQGTHPVQGPLPELLVGFATLAGVLAVIALAGRVVAMVRQDLGQRPVAVRRGSSGRLDEQVLLGDGRLAEATATSDVVVGSERAS